MRRRKWFIAILAVGVLLAAGVASPAAASTSPPVGQYVRLVGLGGGKCVTVQPGASGFGADGLPLWQLGCAGTDVQTWTLIHSGYRSPPGWCHWYDTGCVVLPVYQIVNRATNRCIDVRGGASADGTPIQQWTCDGNDNMLWWFTEGETAGSFQVRSVRTGNCLDVTWNSYDDGAMLQEFHCTSYNEAQRFVPQLIG